jgi:hypothetical protein
LNFVVKYQRQCIPSIERIKSLLDLPGVVRAQRLDQVYADLRVEDEDVQTFLKALKDVNDWKLSI